MLIRYRRAHGDFEAIFQGQLLGGSKIAEHRLTIKHARIWISSSQSSHHIHSCFQTDILYCQIQQYLFGEIQLTIIVAGCIIDQVVTIDHERSFWRYDLHRLTVAVVILPGNSDLKHIAGKLWSYRDIDRITCTRTAPDDVTIDRQCHPATGISCDSKEVDATQKCSAMCDRKRLWLL